MQNILQKNNIIISGEKIYVSICAFFSIMLVINNLVYQKFVTLKIFPFYFLEVSVGAILYPLTFLLSDLISELYGKEKASFCVKLAICLNIIIAIMIAFMDSLPATKWSKINNESFHQIFGAFSIAFIASNVACYLSQMLDVRIYLKIKSLTNDRFLWLRNNVSTIISLFFDTFIVIFIMSIFGVLPYEKLFIIVLHSYILKVCFTICSTPLFYVAVMVLKKLMIRKAGGLI
jgi:uncharacterized integral membrane protein (TIGR00697 family)